MKGSGVLAQQRLMMKKLQDAMDAQDANSCDSAKFSTISPSTDDQ
jgi:hypothetical protein